MKHIKRAAALVLAVMLSLCLSLTAFAEDSFTSGVQATGTLAVSGSGLWIPGNGDTGSGKTVTAIRMFKARVNATAADATDDFDSYELETAWKDFFTKDSTRFGAVLKAGGISPEGVTAENISDGELNDAVIAYVKDLQNTNQMPTFAHNAQKWARVKANKTALNTASLIKTETAVSANESTDATKGVATFTNLTAGYYLVFPEGGSTGNNNRATDALLVNVPKTGANAAAEIKSTFPTVDKKVSTSDNGDFADNGSAQVGDTVTFKLTAKVPDMTDYDTYKFVFHDTLSNGLAYTTNSVKVTVAGAEVIKGTAYTVTEPTAGGKELTVTFTDLKTVNGATTDAEIVVTYTATITKDAVKDKPAENSVYLEYSNDPSSDSTGKSNPDVSKVYTYQIDIFKYATVSGNETALAGATFQLKASEKTTDPAIELVKETENVYHVKGADETKTDDSVTTDTTGKITIKGLKAGTYYLHETAAPTGYNKLTTPVTIVITPDQNDLSKFTYTVNGVANNANDSTVKVENLKGTMLPETGSFGTIGLTILGVAVVLLGVFAPKKKKENR